MLKIGKVESIHRIQNSSSKYMETHRRGKFLFNTRECGAKQRMESLTRGFVMPHNSHYSEDFPHILSI